MVVKSLVGASIRGRWQPSRWGVAGIVVALASGAKAAVGREWDLALFALLPLYVGLAAQVPGDARFRLDVTATGLRDHEGRTILFTSLREVRALVPPNKPRGPHFFIEIVHAGGAVLVPPLITIASEDLYLFIRERLRLRVATLPPMLAAFASEQRATFGPEKVWSCGKRAGAPRSPHPGLRAWWIGGAATGVTWMAATWLSPLAAISWRWIGVMTLVISALFLIVELSGRRGAGAVTPIAGLVISPSALALQLGDLQGQVAWQEILGITYPAKTGFVAVSAVPNSIAVDVAGARILITDSFTHPLDDIHERIQRYWRSPL